MKYSTLNCIAQLHSFIQNDVALENNNISLFIDTSSEQFATDTATPRWQVELHNVLFDLGEQLNQNSDQLLDSAFWEQKIINLIEASNYLGQTIALFINHSDSLILPLPQNVETAVYYGELQLCHLLAQTSQHAQYLVALVSEKEHRIVTVDIPSYRVSSEFKLEENDAQALRPGGKKARTQASERRDLDSETDMARNVAHDLQSYFLIHQQYQHMVLGGNVKLAHSISKNLHPTLSEHQLTIERLPLDAPNSVIEETVAQVDEQQHHLHQQQLFNEIIHRKNQCGRATFGFKYTRDAMAFGQVKKLVVAYPIQDEQTNALLISALKRQIDIEFVFGDVAEQLQEAGGIAASLYYAIR